MRASRACASLLRSASRSARLARSSRRARCEALVTHRNGAEEKEKGSRKRSIRSYYRRLQMSLSRERLLDVTSASATVRKFLLLTQRLNREG